MTFSAVVFWIFLQNSMQVTPFSWSVLFQGFWNLGSLDSLPDFPIFFSLPPTLPPPLPTLTSLEVGGPCDFCLLFLLSFLALLFTPTASVDLSTWLSLAPNTRLAFLRDVDWSTWLSPQHPKPQVLSSFIFHPR